MNAFIFPGQGSQFKGMGQDLYRSSQRAKKLFELANKIINFDISKIMFDGSEEQLKQTNVTQPAIFIHSTILSKCLNNFNPDMVAGHSLGEFSALVATQALSFEDGLKLVIQRAEAMQIACNKNDSTMAAIIGLNAEIIEQVCLQQKGIVVPANYNSLNQIVISGERNTLKNTCKKMIEKGAKKALILPVSGAFHSPIMDSAKESLKKVINSLEFKQPTCPIYQNISGKGVSDVRELKNNLIEQLTSPVKWYQTIENMITNGANKFIEVGPGNVLSGLNKRINRNIEVIKASI